MERPSQHFTRRQLNFMRRWHSQSHLESEQGGLPTNQEEWQTLLTRLESAISKDEFKFSGLRWHSIRGRRALSTKRLEDALVIRKINDNVRRAYGLSQPNRGSLIRTAKQALRENTPKTIIRVDLKGCFESIDRGAVLKALRRDAKVTSETMALIDKLFFQAGSIFPGRMPNGIPRGLTISTSLAEIVLKNLDSKLRMIPGVYLLLRYVDDILIFSTSGVDFSWNHVKSAIHEAGLRLNFSKSHKMRVGCGCETACPHGIDCPCREECKCSTLNKPTISTEYLGYKIIFNSYNSRKNHAFSILSERKSSKIKSRLHTAAQDVKLTGDWQMFQDRTLYLMCNQRVAASPGRRGLFNGLSHTHSEYEEPPYAAGLGTLADLDEFYLSLLRRTIKETQHTPANKAKLQSLRFSSGFRHRRRTKYTAAQTKRIMECWRD